MLLTHKRPAGASEARVPIQNYLYASIVVISAHCFRYSSNILFLTFPCNFTKKASPSDIGIKASLKGPKWASQAQVLFSAPGCLCCWQPNGTSLKDNAYMSSRTVCHKMSNWSAMASRNITASTSRLKWPRFENHTKGQPGPSRHTLFLYCLRKMYNQFWPIFTCIDHFWSCICWAKHD